MNLRSFQIRRAAILAVGLAVGAVVCVPEAAAQHHGPPTSKSRTAQTKDKDKKKAKPPQKSKGPHASGASPAAGGPKTAASTSPPGPPAAPKAPIRLELPVQKVTLDNGLRVVMSVDRTSPTVAVAVTYDVGSRGEQQGRSGFAHLFEHMMFQGSANVPKGEHFKLVSGHGGVLNGTTSHDRTNYFEVLPANELALALWLEADRMKSLDVSAENFENQRKVVQEEYRMRISNVAYAPSSIRLEELVFQGYWPYEHSTIGSMADLDAAQIDWVREFHARHYGPNNAVLTIVGDFDSDEAMALVHRYFDGAKRIDVEPFKDVQLPEQTSQRTAVMKDNSARTPGIVYGWAIPPARHADHYALEIASRLLADGESSRLHQLLVRDKALAQEVSAGTNDYQGPDLFSLDAKLVEKAKVGDVEKLIENEIKDLQTRTVQEAELDKARRRAQSAFVFALQSNVSRAINLGAYEVLFGDARHLNTELARYAAVTAEDVKRVSTKYLGPTRRTIVETYPAGPAPVQAVGGQPPPPKASVEPKVDHPAGGDHDAHAKKGGKATVPSSKKGADAGKKSSAESKSGSKKAPAKPADTKKKKP